MMTYLSTSDAAKLVNVDPATIWRWCAAHPGLAIRVGGRFRLDPRKIKLIAEGVPLAKAAGDVGPR